MKYACILCFIYNHINTSNYEIICKTGKFQRNIGLIYYTGYYACKDNLVNKINDYAKINIINYITYFQTYN